VLSQIRHSVLTVILMAGAVTGWTSPANSKLLQLVPEGAQIVAGIEDPHNPSSSGRLLLVTHNCHLDFKDWVAMSGVDPHRASDEVIKVATSSSGRELKQHLLLVAGRFDREHISALLSKMARPRRSTAGKSCWSWNHLRVRGRK